MVTLNGSRNVKLRRLAVIEKSGELTSRNVVLAVVCHTDPFSVPSTILSSCALPEMTEKSALALPLLDAYISFVRSLF